jgi:hypothetical protein
MAKFLILLKSFNRCMLANFSKKGGKCSPWSDLHPHTGEYSSPSRMIVTPLAKE